MSDLQQDAVRVVYTNHRGETRERLIRPDEIWFGCTDWHPEPQNSANVYARSVSK